MSAVGLKRNAFTCFQLACMNVQRELLHTIPPPPSHINVGISGVGGVSTLVERPSHRISVGISGIGGVNTLKFYVKNFYAMDKALSGELYCAWTELVVSLQ